MAATSANNDTSAAWRYHDGTKHSWHSVHTSNHRLDFQNQPSPFKVYPHLEGRRLPTDLESSNMPALTALLQPGRIKATEPTLKHLAGLLYYTAGITKRGIVPGGQIFFRAAACTGALYHIELYLVCGDFDGLEAGVYHFGPHDFSLRQLRRGDYRKVLAEASGGEPAVSNAPAVLVTSSVYWRNAWKYQARAYRHSYWDSGTMLANLLAMGNAYGLPLKVVTTFVDEPVNNLLGLDPPREAALHLVPVGEQAGGPPPEAPEAPALDLEVTPYSLREIEYPEIAAIHLASSLALPEEVEQLRVSEYPGDRPQTPSGKLIALDPSSGDDIPDEIIEPVVVRRGSSRRFRRDSITFQQLSTMLEASSQDLPADFLKNARGPAYPGIPDSQQCPGPGVRFLRLPS